ncbi:histone-lysine N-methyltransferase SETMAR-like [Onthophagus taurus]|uniref:histone-lysine N-methyltransferase SETMAR-like n=1 Tax=Onthophagus taurus TaxID=166361 RepID=UPI0039BDA7C0
MMLFTVAEKVQIIKWFYGGNSVAQIINLFPVAYENRSIPSRGTISNIIKNFERHGCVSPQKHKLRRGKRDELRDTMICADVERNKNQSSRQVAKTFAISHVAVLKTLKKHGYRSYKVQKSQELCENDNITRAEFCFTMTEMANGNVDFIKNILFTDESTFPLHGRHNPSVARYWSRDNEHKVYAARTQYPQKLNVWAGLVGDHIIGPFFIEGNLNGHKYLNMLQNDVIGSIWFQQDGCPAHNSRQVKEYLNAQFPNRVISINLAGTLTWPPRSPDLAPNDFFLWGYLKSKIYGFDEERTTNLDDLQTKIRNCIQDISPDILANVRRTFYDRLGYCLAQNGGLFEHLI